ncbi:MAG: HAMP domain-containing sensor histidine kinase, partial [Elusimicrobia bacterium]|nr:HAMP domain-containing sensor histidine kinase [Elusimicrobiota bacterium]
HLKLVVQRVLESGRLRRELGAERAMRKELATAYAELQKVEELKESFLSRISHELRTPLSEVAASVALLELAGGDLAKIQKYVAICKSGADKLDRALSDLLAFVELQGQPVVGRREAVDLQALCREAAAKLEPLWRPRRLSVEVRFEEGMPPVSGDRALLARAIEHLLQNAVLFNREGGKVTLEGSVREGSVYLSVSDTGEGIPESEFERIFDSFYQIANYLTRKVGGMGLGLAITRRIVEAHGGHVGVKSKVGEGSTFRVRLPVEPPRA